MDPRNGDRARCPFCRIVDGSDDTAAVVHRSAHVVAFLDRAPLFAGHVLIVPRRHVVTIVDLQAPEVGPFWSEVQLAARVVPEAMQAQGSFVANNNVISQSVAHLHVHVVPRRKGDGLRGFFWPRMRYPDGEQATVAARLAAAFAAAGRP